MIWPLQHPDRSQRERNALEALASSVDWLVPGEWRMDGSLRLTWDAELLVGGQTYSISLRYPNHFPHSPPLVLPRDEASRWSSHQWGAGGELCLEYGADNWHPDITGADMVQSAYRLIAGENPAREQNGRVPSRHKTTLGQDFRSEHYRFLVTHEFAAILSAIQVGELREASVVTTFRDHSVVYVMEWMTDNNGKRWTDKTVPKTIVYEGYSQKGVVLRWPANSLLPKISSRSDLYAAAAAKGIDLPSVKLILIVTDDGLDAYTVWDDNTSTRVKAIPPQAQAVRLNEQHSSLKTRTVAIIGCGSLGSKLAVMLARAGVLDFLLVDDDIMLPDNLVRNDLDWREIGYHKADGVARRINLVCSEAICDIRRYKLGGQHSSGSIETLIEKLATVDLIIDASADSQVFNYLCAAISIGKKALLWARVFGGGFGGFIARHRSGIEPDPATMRAQIEQWSIDQGLPIERAEIDYESRGDGPPMIADDADVSVIAANAARLAIDTLIQRTPSQFPYSVYMIGLANHWTFHEPFDTRPIDVGTVQNSPSFVPDPALLAEETKRLVELLVKRSDASNSSPTGSEASAQ